MKTALIAGSTGLIGGQLLELLLTSDRYDKVVALTRKELPAHSKLVQVKWEPASLSELNATTKADDVFCCLGTTMAKAGSKENFYQVDVQYPFLLAKNSFTLGAKQYLLVSTLGANKKSFIFYTRIKGEVEDAVSSVGFQTVHIFRPSLLIGLRKEERRDEQATQFFYKNFGFLIPKKYKAIESIKVARAMIHFASQDLNGKHIHESGELQHF
jgi:uncharacterized protein YbjT (DUF2867 family)